MVVLLLLLSLLLCGYVPSVLFLFLFFFFFKQKTAYEMRISDWSSDVCSSDLSGRKLHAGDQRTCPDHPAFGPRQARTGRHARRARQAQRRHPEDPRRPDRRLGDQGRQCRDQACRHRRIDGRSEEHTSELQSLMRISYAVFCLKKKKTITTQNKSKRVKNK